MGLSPWVEAELEGIAGKVALRGLEGRVVEHETARYVLANALSGISRAALVIHDHEKVWTRLETGFWSRLPEIKYKWAARTLSKIQLVTVGPEHPSTKGHISSPLNAYKLPYVHLYFVKCSSIEAYRTSVKPRLKAWVEEIKSMKTGLTKTEWMIVFVPETEHSASPAALSAVKKIWERIRADFSTSKTDRVCQVTLYKDAPSAVQRSRAGDGEWGDFLKKICGFIVDSFEARCRVFEGQAAKLEERANEPGWNYCTYLIVKENLAFSWLQLGQYWDALRIFDQLNVKFESIAGSNTSSDLSSKRDIFAAQMLRSSLCPWSSRDDNQAKARTVSDVELGSQLQSMHAYGSIRESSRGARPLRSESTLAREDSASSVHHGAGVSGSQTLSPTTSTSSSDQSLQGSPQQVLPLVMVPSVLLDIKRKGYRDQIYQNVLSVPEIRLYLFVRCSLLLFTVGHQSEALRRALFFIHYFSQNIISSTSRASGLSVAAQGRAALLASPSSTRALSGGAGANGEEADDELPNDAQLQVIAWSWAHAAALELVSASHAANAAHAEVTSDTLAFQAELIAYARACLEQIIRVARPESPSQAVLDRFSRTTNVANLPLFMLGTTSPVSEALGSLDSPLLRPWLPAGVLDAVREPFECASFNRQLLEAEAEYLRAAGYARNAFRLDLFHAELCVAAGELAAARRVLEGPCFRARRAVRSFESLDAERRLLLAKVRAELGDHLVAAGICLQVLCLRAARPDQRSEALGLLQSVLAHLTLRRVSASTFPLVTPLLGGIRSTSVAQSNPGEVTEHWNTESLSLKVTLTNHLPSRVIASRVYVRLKRALHGLDDTSKGETLSASSRKGSCRSVDDLIRYRAVGSPPTDLDEHDSLDGNESSDCESLGTDEYMGLESSSELLTESESCDDEDEEDDGDEEDDAGNHVSLGTNNPVIPGAQNCEQDCDVDEDQIRNTENQADSDSTTGGGDGAYDNDDDDDNDDKTEEDEADVKSDGKGEGDGQTTLVDDLSSGDGSQASEILEKSPQTNSGKQAMEESLSDDLPPPPPRVSTTVSLAVPPQGKEAGSELRLGPISPITGETECALSSCSSTRQRKRDTRGHRFLYIEAHNVELVPGEQELTLRSMPKSLGSQSLPSGEFVPDRFTFQLESKLDVVLDLDDGDRSTSPSNSRNNPALPRIRVLELPPLFGIQVQRPPEAFIPFGDTDQAKEEVRLSCNVLRTDPAFDLESALVRVVGFLPDRGSAMHDVVTRVGQDSLGSVLSLTRDALARTEQEQFNLNLPLCISRVQARDFDRIVVCRQGQWETLRCRDDSRSEIVHYTVEVETEAQVQDGGMLSTIVQTSNIRMRCGAPFLMTQCARVEKGRLWVSISLSSNMPFPVHVSDVSLENAEAVLGQESYLVHSKHTLKLIFHAPLPTTLGTHRLKFRGQYDGLGPAPVSGRCDREVSFRVLERASCFLVATSCVNLEAVRVGSTATIVFSLRRDTSCVRLVESTFASSDVDTVEVAPSPAHARGRRARTFCQKEEEDSPVYSLAFDPNQWMVIGSERGRIVFDGDEDSSRAHVACEFVPLVSGSLALPVLETSGIEIVQEAGGTPFLSVRDE